MNQNRAINFGNIRMITGSGRLPLFFVEDIKAAYLISADEGAEVIEKYGQLVSEEIRVWVVPFEGMEALIASAMYGFGGEPKDLRRYRKLMAD